MVEQIFIGGTGRSGTTILSKVLGNHKEIYRYPFETRFIIDPDGLLDLVPVLSDDWSPWKGDAAVRRFRKMMREMYPKPIRRVVRTFARKVLTKFEVSPPRYGLSAFCNIIPREKFVKIVDQFIGSITIREFRGYWLGSKEYVPIPKIISTGRIERNKIMELSRDFVNSISRYPMEKSNKKIWLDHTPYNIIHAFFLYEMFPDMKLIHIYRDVRDVIASYKTTKWGGNHASDIIMWIKYVFEKWEEEKRKIPKKRYYELKMEELIKNPKEKLKEITDFLDIEFDCKMLEIDLSKGHAGRWKKDIDHKEMILIEENLSEILDWCR